MDKKNLVLKKLRNIIVYMTVMALFITGLPELVLSAKAADTGFASGESITSDTAVDYCWTNSEVNLSVIVINGTEVKWSLNRENDGVEIKEQADTTNVKGTSKNLKVKIGENAAGAYTITAATSNDSRTITLNVLDSLSDIASGSDFSNQHTATTFEVSTVVDERYADTVTWASDNENVTVESLDSKTDSTKYSGSVVKYAKVTLGETKPESGSVNISVTANNVTKTQNIIVKKSATNLTNIKVISSDKETNLDTYTHMSSDTIYVDMNETIKLSATVKGTIINVNKEQIDDALIIGIEQNDNFTVTSTGISECSDSHYTKVYSIKGLLATEKPINITIQTESGKVAKDYKVVVLAPATDMGLCLEENYSKFNLKNYTELSENELNIDGNGVTIKEGNTIDLKEIFKPQFKETVKQKYNYDTQQYEDTYEYSYLCDSTDEAYWTSSDTDVATVSQKGEVTALKEGSATITCKAKETLTSGRNTYSATYKIYVSKINLASAVQITDSNGAVMSTDTLFTSTTSKKYSAKQLPKESGVIANENITWASSDESVFKVDNNGTVTPKSAGKAILYATTEKTGLIASMEIEVIAAVQTIELSKLTTGIEGHIYELVATVDSGANQNEELTWTISNSNIALIDPNDVTMTELNTFKGKRCLVKIKSNSGTCEITVKGKYLASAIANTKVTCTPAYTASTVKILQDSKDLTGKSIDVIKGDKVILTSLLQTVDGKTSNDDFVWEVENNTNGNGDKILDIVTDISKSNVENIEFTPLTKGTVTIKLRDVQTNEVSVITINAKVPATSLSVEEEKVVVLPNGTYDLTVELLPLDTSDVIEFTSSNEKIATVSKTGQIKGIKSSEEEVIITAKINDELIDTCKVIVAIPADDEMKIVDANTEEILTTNEKETNKVYLDGTRTVNLRNIKNITADVPSSNEPIVWETSDEKIASLKPSEDTYSCTINGNKIGIATITARSSISNKVVKFNVRVTQRYNSLNLSDTWDVDYNSTSNYSIYLRNEYYDTIKWSVEDPEIIELTNIRDGSTEKVTFRGLKAGTTTVTATSADGLVTDSMEVTVNPIRLSYNATISVDDDTEFVYDGTEKKAAVTVISNDGTVLEENVDYKLVYENNIEAGTASVKITGIGNYKSDTTKYFKVSKRDMTNVKVVVSTQGNVYNFGNQVKPKSIVVTDLGKTLVEGKDYSLSYSNNKNAGTATVEIASRSGNYTGSKEVNYTIQPINIAKAKIAKIDVQTYTGKSIKPVITVTINTGDNVGTLTQGKSFKAVYSNNKKIGKTAQVKIIGMGNYSGEKTRTFTIKPKATKLKSVKVKTSVTGAKSMVVKWSRDKQATGYEIQYSTDYNFKTGKKTVKITKGKTTSKTIKKLKADKYYYVRMRTYKKVKGKKIYSDWSDYKRVSTYNW